MLFKKEDDKMIRLRAGIQEKDDIRIRLRAACQEQDDIKIRLRVAQAMDGIKMCLFLTR